MAGEGCESRVEHKLVGGGLLQLCGGIGVGGGGVQGEAILKLAGFGILDLGDDGVGHGVGDAELPALLEGFIDGGVVSQILGRSGIGRAGGFSSKRRSVSRAARSWASGAE